VYTCGQMYVCGPGNECIVPYAVCLHYRRPILDLRESYASGLPLRWAPCAAKSGWQPEVVGVRKRRRVLRGQAPRVRARICAQLDATSMADF
jgi:hypothetical protein